VYYYHPYCWKFVKNRSESDVSDEQLLAFGQSSSRLFCLSNRPNHDSDSVVTDASALTHKEGQELFRRVEELPPELRRMIVDYAGNCPNVSLLHIVNNRTLDLLARTVMKPNQSQKCPIAKHMKFFFVFIEDSWCWCGCSTDKGIFGYQGPKAVDAHIPSSANSVRFTLGSFGIRGLQIQGPNETSNLIGDFHESLWIGEMHSSGPIQHLLLRLDVGYKHTGTQRRH
jgi:hypothetical protein